MNTKQLSPETLDYLKKRADAHKAECDRAEDDPLIRATFQRPDPIKPLKTPMTPGGMLKRQAD
jgi:hypothetical protein